MLGKLEKTNQKMKKTTLFLLSAAIIGTLLTSCSKVDDGDTNNNGISLNDITVSDSFSWSTAAKVDLAITGLPTIVPVKSTLTITLKNGSVLFKQLHQMDQNLTVRLTVPTTEKELVLQYGSTTYTVAIAGKQAAFSFIPVVID
jgi:hypothetical protein